MVVFVSFSFQLHYVTTGGHGQTSFLGVLRMVRLLRLFVVMNKIQTQREQQKRARHLKANSSPAERVMELLSEMKSRVVPRPGSETLAGDIDWMIELMVSERLYTIDLMHVHDDRVDSEMTAFLSGTAGTRSKRVQKRVRQHAEPVEPARAVAGNSRRRASVKMVRVSAPALSAAQLAKGVAEEKDEDRTELDRVEATLRTAAAQSAVADVHAWGVDVFDFHAKTGGSGLVVGAHELMESYGLIRRFNLDVPRMVSFFRRIQDGYRDNPYHR